jgi:hypothetical protein
MGRDVWLGFELKRKTAVEKIACCASEGESCDHKKKKKQFHKKMPRTTPTTSRSSPSTAGTTSKRALLLGMVYSKETNPSRGQGYRDRIRCESLETNGGYIVDTLDNKHDESIAKDLHHCRANFADPHRMFKNLKLIWDFDGSTPRYDVIILDYFFSPAGWVNTRWTEKFFTETLISFLTKSLLKNSMTVSTNSPSSPSPSTSSSAAAASPSLWLPNNSYVHEMILKHSNLLSEYYTWSAIPNPSLNPLYAATDLCVDELLLCPDNLTNETQISYLMTSPGGPFLCFQPKQHLNILKPIKEKNKRKQREQQQSSHHPAPVSRKRRIPSSSFPSSLSSSSSDENAFPSSDENFLNQDILILSEDESSNLTTITTVADDSDEVRSARTTQKRRRQEPHRQRFAAAVGV